MRFHIVLSIVILALFGRVNAQQTQFYLDKEQAYTKGLELFDEKNYLAAREKFEDIYKVQKPITDHGNEVLLQNLEYYIAVCAVEANDKDAEKLLLAYQKNYHETDKRRLIYFYLGKYYYNNKNYSEAIDYFTKVNVTDLDNTQLYDYKFQLGYSYFTRKKFTEAKPYFSAIKDVKEKYFYPANYYYAFICFYTKDYDEALKSFNAIEDSKMYSSVIPYYVAQIYYIKKDYDKLTPYLKRNIERSDVLYVPEMKFLLGQVYFQQSEYAKALPLLEEYISKNTKVQKENIYQLAYCQYKTGAYNKAIENFKQLNLLQDTLGQNSTYALGDCYLKTGQKDKARSAFQSASTVDFDKTIKQNSLYHYAKLSFELGYTTDAIQAFEAYTTDYPTGTYIDDANELLAAALVQTRNYERAYRMMEKMKMKSALIKEAYQKVTYFRAVELFNDGKTDEALSLVNKSLTTPLNLEIQGFATYLKGEILYGQGQFTQAAEQYMKFNQMATPAIEKKGEASKFRSSYNLAYCYFKQKNYGSAEIYFGYAVDEADNTLDVKGKQALLPDLYMRFADCSFVNKNYGKALTTYSKIVDQNYNGADYAQYQKGIILGLQNKDNEKISAMSYLISHYPVSNYVDRAYYEAGETHLIHGRLPAARAAYQSVITKFPTSTMLSKSYLKTAVIDYNSGKKEEAINGYKEVVRKFPKSSEEKEALEALRDIYVEVGRAEEYFEFAKNTANVNISTSEQDSLIYQSAENAYNSNDCAKAITLLGNYLTKFPDGYFAQDANWKKSECHLKSKDYTAALTSLEAIIENKYGKYYERALLKASGIAFYEVKNYDKALNLYRMLYVASSSQPNTYTALTGMFHAAVQLKNNEKIIELADQLVNSGVAKEADIQAAYSEKGKAWYAMGNKDFAMNSFNRVAEYPVNERCVEAKYMVAKILFERNDYKASLDTCFKLKTKYASYEYWVVKSFILMADNYYAQGNGFQAKATLESIVNNYEGDQAVLNEAKEKLEKIRTEELNKTKIMQVMPQDTLIMESDSLINNNNK